MDDLFCDAPFSQTRDGRKARIICRDAKGNHPVIALIATELNRELVNNYTKNGRFWSDVDISDVDLINVPEKAEFYINFNPSSEGVDVGGVYASRSDAEKWSTSQRLSCQKIEFKEGQFDE